MKFEKLVAGCLVVGLMGSAVPFVDVNNVPAITAKATEVIDSGKISDTISWTITDDYVLTISGEGEMPVLVSDDSSLAGEDTDKRGWKGSYFYKIETVVVEEGITSLGQGFMYRMNSVTALSLPSTLKTIDVGAFQDCWSLTEIDIPDGVTSIGTRAFGGCSGLKRAYIPDSVTTIGESTFSGCKQLEDVHLSSNLTEIPNGCFFSLLSVEGNYYS